MASRLRHEDLAFLTRAPVRQVHRGHVSLPTDRVFAGLAARPDSWPAWLSLARDCHYEGPPPHGVGTVRVMSLPGGIRARERVLAWDEDERFAYRVDEINVPGVRAFMEEWRLAPVSDGRTQLQWTLAFDCAPPAALLLRAARNRIGRIFSEGTSTMAAVL
jgi:hypothetical protein